MELKDVLLKRRSIRKFKDVPISNEIIEELLHAGMSGPSACNRQPWEFYVVQNKIKLKEVTKASLFSRHKPSIAIVVCGHLSRFLPSTLSAYWMQDCSAATENILLRVTDLGLGAVWCGLYPQKNPTDRIKKILNLDDKLIPMALVLIGYPDQELEPRDQYDSKKVHYIE